MTGSGTMQTAAIDQTELPSMLATLCSYESWLGPYHPQTLRLMAHVAIAYWRAGEAGHARPLLERAVRDLRRYSGPDQDLRLRAMATLRDLFVAQRDYERAGAVQRELLECQVQRLGGDHPETLATRADLAMMLLEKMTSNSNRKA
jgi:hypothetical protein